MTAPEIAARPVPIRAAIYELFSCLLSAPNASHGRRALHLAFALGRAEDVPEQLRDSFRRLTNALAGVGLNEIERAWQSTFGLTDGGPLSLCETEYGMAHIFQKSNTLADIAGFYRAFGLERADTAERPDHLSVELEFLSFLAIKQSHAAETGKQDLAEMSRAAERLFLSEHTGRFAPGLFKRIAAAGGFYGDAAKSGLDAITWVMAEHGFTAPEQLAPSGPQGPEEPLSCGSCSIGADRG